MAGEGDAERLIVLLEARIRDFEKNMAKASGTADRSYDRMRRGSRSATRQMEADMARSAGRINQALAATSTRIGAFGRAFLGGVVGGIAAGGIAGIVSQLGRMAEGIAAIGDEAKRAGVSAQAFQEWKIVAEQARIPVDSMIDGLKELNLRADEFVITGKGPAAEAFARLGYTAEELKTKLKDPSALLLEIIGRLGQMDKAAQIRIADEVFGGTGGERFVELIAQGEDGIKATIDQAHRLGNIMDDQMIAKAAEVDRQFQIVSTTVGTALKSAIVDAVIMLQDFIDRFNGFEAQRDAALGERLSAIGGERLDLKGQLFELNSRERSGESVGDGIFGTRFGESSFGEARADLERQIEALSAEEEMINKVLEQRRKLRAAPQASTSGTPWTPPPPPPPGGGSNRDSADEYERLASRITEATAAKVAETEAQRQLNPAVDDYGYALERARLEHELLAAAQEAGRAITPALRAEIAALADQYGQAAAEAAKLGEEQGKTLDELQWRRDTLKGVLGDMRQALSDGRLEWQELGDIAMSVLDRIIDKIENELLDALFKAGNAGGGGGGGGSILSSLLGGLLGGAGGGFTGFEMAWTAAVPGLWAKGGAFDRGRVVPFAKGGAFSNRVVDRPTVFPMADGAGLMGEAGPEAIMPLKRGADGRLGVAGSGGGQQTVNLSNIFHIDASNAQAGVGDEIKTAIRDAMKDLTPHVVKALRDIKKRGISV